MLDLAAVEYDVPRLKCQHQAFTIVLTSQPRDIILYIFVFFKDHFKTELVLQTLFLPKTEAIKSVWQAFE